MEIAALSPESLPAVASLVDSLAASVARGDDALALAALGSRVASPADVLGQFGVGGRADVGDNGGGDGAGVNLAISRLVAELRRGSPGERVSAADAKEMRLRPRHDYTVGEVVAVPVRFPPSSSSSSSSSSASGMKGREEAEEFRYGRVSSVRTDAFGGLRSLRVVVLEGGGGGRRRGGEAGFGHRGSSDRSAEQAPVVQEFLSHEVRCFRSSAEAAAAATAEAVSASAPPAPFGEERGKYGGGKRGVAAHGGAAAVAAAEEAAAAAAAAAAIGMERVSSTRGGNLNANVAAAAAKRELGKVEARRLDADRSAAGADASSLVRAASDLLARAGMSLQPEAKAMMKEKARLSAEVAALEASAGRMSKQLKALDGAAKALTCPLTLEIFVDPVVSKYGR